MSPPPTSIDGTDITGATIDGQAVQEITIDGQIVFKATETPTAYSNLVAWYPFDSSFYGGSNVSDVTALFEPAESGDSEAYDAGPGSNSTYKTSGGADDLNAGPSSGYYELNDGFLDGPNGSDLSTYYDNITTCFWIKTTNTNVFDHAAVSGGDVNAQWQFNRDSPNRIRVFWRDGNRDAFDAITTSPTNWTDGTYHHLVAGVDSPNNQFNVYVDGIKQSVTVNTANGGSNFPVRDIQEFFATVGGQDPATGDFDDLRFYNRQLTQSEVDSIILNTDPT
jgi:hypothetical protein